MQVVVDYLKGSWRLESPFFLLDLVAVGVALLYLPRTRIWGRRWLTTVALGYWALSTPAGSWMFSAPLAWHAPRIESRAQAANADIVVVLGGGIETHVADRRGIDDLDK